MSIIAYYVHLSAAQLNQLRGRPDQLWQMQGDASFAGAELYDMDKDWQVLPWLLSDKKRQEQQWQTAQMAVLMRTDISPTDAEGFNKALAQERQKLGVTSDRETTDKMPNDAALLAIEGRGTKD